MWIDLFKWFGEAPKYKPEMLPDGFAQLAVNCDLSGGILAPMRGLRDIKALGVAGVRSIYKYGYQSADEGNWWFAFDRHVDVAKTQVFGDVEERTYFTGDWPAGAVRLQKTRFDLAIAGQGPYPAVWLDGSIPKPGSAITVLVTGGNQAVEPESLFYTTTFVTSWDEESEPGPTSARVIRHEGGTAQVSGIPNAPSGAHTINRVRLWRWVDTGDAEGDIRMVAELPIGTTTFTDNIATIDLSASTLQTKGWDAAPEGLKGLRNLPNQMAVAHKDFDVYLCEPQAYYAWPVEYVQSLDGKVMATAGYGQALVALTENKTYIGYGTDPESINLVKAEVPDNCGGTTSARSVVADVGGVVHANRHGVISLGSGGATLITEKYMGKEEWAAFSPDTILGSMDGGKYMAFWETGDQSGGLILDPDVQGLVRTSIHATAAHQHNGRLYLAVDDRLCAWGEGDELELIWRSKRFTLPSRVNFSVMRVLADGYPLTVNLYAGGKRRVSKVVRSNDEVTLKSGYTADDLEVEIVSRHAVRRVTIAETPEELADVSA